MGQTLTEWYTTPKSSIDAVCICSDAGVSTKKGNADDVGLQQLGKSALRRSTLT
jgi:predicted helicase